MPNIWLAVSGFAAMLISVILLGIAKSLFSNMTRANRIPFDIGVFWVSAIAWLVGMVCFYQFFKEAPGDIFATAMIAIASLVLIYVNLASRVYKTSWHPSSPTIL